MRVKGTVPKNINILKGPLSLKALKARAENGRISVNIVYSLNEAMTDIESFNDIADERVLDLNTISGSLSDIVYNVVGSIPARNKNKGGWPRGSCTGGGYLNGSVIINVDAGVSDIIEE